MNQIETVCCISLSPFLLIMAKNYETKFESKHNHWTVRWKMNKVT